MNIVIEWIINIQLSCLIAIVGIEWIKLWVESFGIKSLLTLMNNKRLLNNNYQNNGNKK